MSEDQQIILLEQLEAMPAVELPERTVSLEGNDSSMRENPRKPCLINANYRVQNKDFKSYILDISIGGVFIETSEKFTIGQKVELNFALRGFGLKFDGVPAQQGEILRSFVEQKE